MWPNIRNMSVCTYAKTLLRMSLIDRYMRFGTCLASTQPDSLRDVVTKLLNRAIRRSLSGEVMFTLMDYVNFLERNSFQQ